MRTQHATRRLLGLVLVGGLLGCGDLLEVDNPNNIKGEDIENPAAAGPLANGALSSIARGYGAIMAVYATATDELDWIGSRDAWQQLDFGNFTNPFNEFTDAAFPFVSEGRWLADEAVKVLGKHYADGKLPVPKDYARALLYSAISYVTIADMFDNFVFSNRTEAKPPIGQDNMGILYDSAVARLDRALPIAQAANDANLVTAVLAMRARAKHGRAVWNLVGKRPISGGLVNSAGAVADAQAALAAAPTATWTYAFKYSATTIGAAIGSWVNQRQEMRFGSQYIYSGTPGRSRVDSIKLRDPIDNVVDPPVSATILAFAASTDYPTLTITSTREMHLIIAEARLQAGDMVGFATAINAIRAMDGLTAWNVAAPQIPALDLLIHTRRSSLFLQGKRLADMYRFGITDPVWRSGSDALTAPGTFLPITAIECLANPHIGVANCGK